MLLHCSLTKYTYLRVLIPQGRFFVVANLGFRQELLNWLNNLLQLNITRVEQCGTGYVYNSLNIGEGVADVDVEYV
jgi:hypothetical protein